MGITYKKLWIMLIERSIAKTELREMADISPATLTKLNKNKYVHMEILEKICRALNCSFDDIVELIPQVNEGDKQSEENKSNGGDAK